ncbi:hypothetical protein [Amorphus coralli]|uniref:hypothetical protein n=1 Tax=Amorphus coralli TaxID=340680 RepID=UPI0003780BC0|nr:hypothetical protein [Amorphus coralli]
MSDSHKDDDKQRADEAARLKRDERTKKEKSEDLDEALDDTFPASDPPVQPSITGRD